MSRTPRDHTSEVRNVLDLGGTNKRTNDEKPSGTQGKGFERTRCFGKEGGRFLVGTSRVLSFSLIKAFEFPEEKSFGTLGIICFKG